MNNKASANFESSKRERKSGWLQDADKEKTMSETLLKGSFLKSII